MTLAGIFCLHSPPKRFLTSQPSSEKKDEQALLRFPKDLRHPKSGSPHTTSAHAEHYRVYLLGGQSNGNGRGDAAELSTPPLDALNLDTSQTDVRVYWHKTQNTTNGNLTQDTWIDLQPGSGHGVNSPSGHPVEFGPELTFGRTMADNDPLVKIAIIKHTEGGTNLHTQWSASGSQYASFVATVQAGLTALTAMGDTYEIGGMIWVQGEADTSGSNATNYKANLTDLITRVRQDVFGGPVPGGFTLPFVISGLSDSQYPNITTVGTGPYTVRQAQETVAAKGRQTAFVNTDGLSTYSNGAVHFDASAQVSIGQASAAQMLLLEANDADRDGLLLREATTLGTNASLADTDGDGWSDGFENAAGTNPLSNASLFAICDVGFSNGSVTLQWPSAPGNLYEVQVSSDLQSWETASADYPATDPGTVTSWTATLENLPSSGTPSLAQTLANYDAQAGLNGDFDTTAFDSVDANTKTTAGRMSQGGSLTGGGASLFILNRAQDRIYFDGHSDSGSPGFNFGGVNEADQAAAATAGDYFEFTLQAHESLSYDSLTFFANQFSTSGKVDISYTIGTAQEIFVLQGLTPTTGNAPVTKETVDFPNFSTSEDVTWTFYLYNSGGSNNGIRFDDIQLLAQPSSSLATEVLSRFTFTGPPWTAAKESDFATFATKAPSDDTATRSVTSELSNNGYTSGGYSSFYIRDIDGGTVGIPDSGDFQIFSTSSTPGVGMNFGNTNATVPTHSLSFTVTPVSGAIT